MNSRELFLEFLEAFELATLEPSQDRLSLMKSKLDPLLKKMREDEQDAMMLRKIENIAEKQMFNAFWDGENVV